MIILTPHRLLPLLRYHPSRCLANQIRFCYASEQCSNIDVVSLCDMGLVNKRFMISSSPLQTIHPGLHQRWLCRYHPNLLPTPLSLNNVSSRSFFGKVQKHLGIRGFLVANKGAGRLHAWVLVQSGKRENPL